MAFDSSYRGNWWVRSAADGILFEGWAAGAQSTNAIVGWFDGYQLFVEQVKGV